MSPSRPRTSQGAGGPIGSRVLGPKKGVRFAKGNPVIRLRYQCGHVLAPVVDDFAPRSGDHDDVETRGDERRELVQ